MLAGPDLAEPVELAVIDYANHVHVALVRNLRTLLLHCLDSSVLVQV